MRSARPGMGRAVPLALLAGRGSMRQPMVYVALIAFPASYFLVLSLLSGPRLGRHALIGAIVAFSVNAGVVSLPQTVLLWRARRLQDMFVASPVRPLTYAVGLALSRLLFITPPLVIVVGLFAVTAHITFWPMAAVLVAVALAWLTGSLLGFAAARRWDDPANVSAIANMLGLLLVLLPPVYYPLALLPEEVRLPVLLVPTANVAELARGITGLSTIPPGQLVYQLAALLAVAGAAAWFTGRDRHWREP